MPTLVTPSGGDDRVFRLELSARGPSYSAREVGSLEPVSLVVSAVKHTPYRYKSTDRDQFDQVLAEAKGAGVDDAIMLTEGGTVAECAIWTLFWWEGTTVCTPALSLGVLPGVARARIADLHGGLVEREIGRAQLPATGLFVANAVRGIVSVATVDGEKVADAPATADLRARFWP